MICPYLSGSVQKVNPANCRRVPVQEALFEIQPDILLYTHGHPEHYDPETAPRFLAQRKPMTALCPHSVWQKVRGRGGGHSYVLFDCGVQWTQADLRFTAVKAAHSNPYAIGNHLSQNKNHHSAIYGTVTAVC